VSDVLITMHIAAACMPKKIQEISKPFKFVSVAFVYFLLWQDLSYALMPFYCIRTKPLASTIALLRFVLKRRLLLRSTLFSRPLVVMRATSVLVSASRALASCCVANSLSPARDCTAIVTGPDTLPQQHGCAAISTAYSPCMKYRAFHGLALATDLPKCAKHTGGT